MAWRDSLQQAEFREVPFYVQRVESAVGRRSVVHEFPGRDKPYVEDLGKRPRRFTIDAYILGETYDEIRDELIVALEKSGPGKLVHPYWGDVSVAVEGDVKITETTDEGGMCRFSITFVEAGELPATLTFDSVGDMTEACGLVATGLAGFIEDVCAFADQVASVYNDAMAAVNDVTSTLRSIRGKVQSVISSIEAVTNAIKAIEDNVTALLALPGDLVDSFVDAFTAMGQAVAGIQDAFSDALDDLGLGDDTDKLKQSAPTAGGPLSDQTRAAMLTNVLLSVETYGDDWTTVSPTTTSRQQLVDNRAALVVAVKAAAVVGVVQGIATDGMTFSDRDQAIGLRNKVSDAIDELLLTDDISDELFTGLRTLQTTVNAHLNEVAGTLPEVTDFQAPGTLPALVIAHRLYNDPTREAELIARNASIRHPGLVSGGQAIKVAYE
jgi:prophage DNA circulation protein